MLARRVQQFTSAEILEFIVLSQTIKDPINLSIGIPYANTPPAIKNAAISAIRHNNTRYTEVSGTTQLREAVIAKLKSRNNIEASFANTMITSGVSAGLFLAMAAILDPGDEILIPDPFFLAYRELAVLLGATPVYVDTYPDFALTSAKLQPYITPRTKAILINTPNNPSGKIYAAAELRGIAELAQRSELYVIADEIYEDFIYESEHFSIGSIYSKTITLNGWSKNYAMTGFRLGYAQGPEDVIQAMKELQQFVFFSSSSIAQHAALEAMSTSNARIISYHHKARRQVLRSLHPAYDRSGGEGSFFLFLKHPDLNGRQVFAAGIERRLIVIPGHIFSTRGSHFRLSYSAPLVKLKEGVQILNDLITV